MCERGYLRSFVPLDAHLAEVRRRRKHGPGNKGPQLEREVSGNSHDGERNSIEMRSEERRESNLSSMIGKIKDLTILSV